MSQERGSIQFDPIPEIGEDKAKPFYPADLPKNPNLITEVFWNNRKQVRETLNHHLYRRLINFGCGTTIAYVAVTAAGWIMTGKWQVGVGLFLLGALAGSVTHNLSEEYNQKLKDAGHPYIKTEGIV